MKKKLAGFRRTEFYKKVEDLIDNEIKKLVMEDANNIRGISHEKYLQSVALIKAYKTIKLNIEVHSDEGEV